MNKADRYILFGMWGLATIFIILQAYATAFWIIGGCVYNYCESWRRP